MVDNINCAWYFIWSSCSWESILSFETRTKSILWPKRLWRRRFGIFFLATYTSHCSKRVFKTDFGFISRDFVKGIWAQMFSGTTWWYKLKDTPNRTPYKLLCDPFALNGSAPALYRGPHHSLPFGLLKGSVTFGSVTLGSVTLAYTLECDTLLCETQC